MKDNPVGWAMVAVAVVALALFAFMFRYEPISKGLVWDRLGHRVCVTVPLDRGLYCTSDDLKHQSEAQPGDKLATMNGAQMRRYMLDEGVPQNKVDAWERQSTLDLLHSGMTPDAIKRYWGQK